MKSHWISLSFPFNYLPLQMTLIGQVFIICTDITRGLDFSGTTTQILVSTARRLTLHMVCKVFLMWQLGMNPKYVSAGKASLSTGR